MKIKLQIQGWNLCIPIAIWRWAICKRAPSGGSKTLRRIMGPGRATYTDTCMAVSLPRTPSTPPETKTFVSTPVIPHVRECSGMPVPVCKPDHAARCPSTSTAANASPLGHDTQDVSATPREHRYTSSPCIAYARYRDATVHTMPTYSDDTCY